MYCEATVLTTSVVQVSVVDGALDCWVFLSCLEVLHRIEGCCDPAQLAANSTHTVGLWVYAIEKVSSAFSKLNFQQFGSMQAGTVQICLEVC